MPDAPIFNQTCGCDDCQAAVSPAAYLAALLDYALKHIRKNGKDKIDLPWLVATFYQPFSDLPTDCHAVEQTVYQARLCIEVLRAYLGSRPLADATKEAALSGAEADYLFAAYNLLLGQFGTSYEEIRRARSETVPNRKALAVRLGLTLTEPRPADLPADPTQNGDELDQLYLEPPDAPGGDHPLTPPVLESLFGLADTTRNPLSTGAKLGDSTAQITHWNISGGEWNHNTDATGQIYLSLTNPAAGIYRAEVYRDQARTQLVASGDASAPTATIRLAPKNDSALNGTLDVTYTADTTDISLTVIPTLLSWQYRHLRASWFEQDHPTDPYSDGAIPPLPVVDPDLIGPDDFRAPVSKTGPGDPDKAFDLWLRRRTDIDTSLNALKNLRETNGLDALLQQALGNPLPDLDNLLYGLSKGQTTGEVTAAKTGVLALGLAVESFTRLMAIRAKDRLFQADARNETVTPAEWGELYSILAQVAKQKQFPTWQAEEAAAGVIPGAAEFWNSLNPPQEGDWPPVVPAGQPLIDPVVLKPADLPEWLAGKAALALWKARQAALEGLPAQLKQARETNGFENMLRLALGHPNAGDPLQYDLDLLKNNLANPDETVRNQATQQIEGDLHLPVENFRRLLAVRAADAQLDPAKKPNAADYTDVYNLLVPAYKIKRLYPLWLQQEQTQGLVYWQALKARLPRWRASLEARLTWQQALHARSLPPILDPQVVEAGYLRNVLPGDPAFDVWKVRSDRLVAWHDALKAAREAAPDSLSGLDSLLQATFGVAPADLELLDQAQKAGQAVEKRFEQLQLDNGAFTFLMRLHELARSAQPITAAEWEIVYATLANVKNTLAAAADQAEERDKKLFLTPDFFKVPDASLALPVLTGATSPFWLSRWQDRRDWQDSLQARLDQEKTLADGLQTALNAVEEATLPALRDALIAASDAVGNSADERAEWITARLLIDARVGGCQTTTRTAQALETLQTFLFDLRSGQFKQLPAPAAALSLVADNFDEEWRWIGSYATFRAATFVYIYPENILQPSLLRYKSPAFGQLITDTKTFRLGPDNACSEAALYADYFNDICSLEIQATAQATTIMYGGDGCDSQPAGSRSMFYMFARAASGKLYWSAYDTSEAAGSGYAPTFWMEIPYIGNITDGRIIGAMPYRKGAPTVNNAFVLETAYRTSYIHLFFIIGEVGKQTLKLARLNLDKFGYWDPTIQPLSSPLPLNSKTEIIPIQTQDDQLQPGLVFHAYDINLFYYRTLNNDGTDWDQNSAEWSVFANTVLGDLVNGQVVVQGNIDGGWRSLKAALAVNGDNWFIIRNHINASDEAWICTVNGRGKRVTTLSGILTLSGSVIGAIPGPELGWKAAIGARFSSEIYLFSKDDNTGAKSYRRYTLPSANRPDQPAVADLMGLPPHSGTGPAGQKMVAFQRVKNGSAYYMFKYRESGDKLIGQATIRAGLRLPVNLGVPLHLTEPQLQQRRQDILKTYALNSDASFALLAPLREALYFVPLHLALALQSSKQYLAALDCFRTFYDYEAPVGPPNTRNIYYGLELDAKLADATVYQQSDGWLLDPLNPHQIATTRRYAYTRFTIMVLVRCLLDYADNEFAQESGESLARARTLYLTALDLLNLPELQQKLGTCADLVAELKIEPGKDIPPEVVAAVTGILDGLTIWLPFIGSVTDTVKDVSTALSGAGQWSQKLDQARLVVQGAIASAPATPKMGGLVTSKAEFFKEKGALLVSEATIDQTLQTMSNKLADKIFAGLKIDPAALPGGAKTPTKPPLLPPPVFASLQFCIPPNPMLRALRLHAELNLFKLRSCRNIAGLKRQLDPYSAPTDTVTGLPSIGAGGQLVLPGVARLQPTLYRYQTLIERARQLIDLSAQTEGAMFAAIQKRDMEAQTLLQARQQLSLAQAGVRLQDLMVTEARGGVTLATLQQSRAQIQVDYFTQLLQNSISELEQEALDQLNEAANYQVDAAGESYAAYTIQTVMAVADATAAAAAAASIIDAADAPKLLSSAASHAAGGQSALAARNNSLASAASTRASILASRASYERRAQDWSYQQTLAQKDVDISTQQIQIANDHVEVVGQQRVIAGIQADNARDYIEFLTKKFTSVELYDWMSNVLEGVYSYFLQQATTIAKLAESQLAFERQEVPPTFIKVDYWEMPSDDNVFGPSDGGSQDRRGLTGSARLLQDIYQLDQYAFDTNKRKLQLTKTISLSQLAPAEFQRLRETGQILFATTLEMFDREFPGHYLRLIKRVRTSIIALIPPVQGIRATLTTTGPSRVVIGGDIFQTVVVRRDPEYVAYTSPINATGLFELDPQPDMLLPFEGSGVEMSWEFSLPKAANQLDYRAIADVLITIEYTALNSFDYRQQVLQLLKPTVSVDRPFSFRNQFADQWYDLHNPAQTNRPMTVRFTTLREDFPPNLENLKIAQVLMYFTRNTLKPFEVPVSYLRFTAQDEPGMVGGSATSIDGVISTRRGNAGSWTTMIGKSPVGTWELALPDTEEWRNHFYNEEIDDILFVITFSGRTPPWPQ